MLLLFLVLLACVKENHSFECANVDTSEGRVNLEHGQAACAPLLDGETVAADAGKRFITCSNGHVHMQSCPGVLRFQVSSGICHWPQWGDCTIPGAGVEETQTAASATTLPPTTAWPKPTTTTNTTKQDTPAVSTEQPLQQTTNLSNWHTTTAPAGTQTTYTSKLPLGTTQNGNNPSTDKDIQYTTGIPTNAPAGTQTTYTSKLPLGTTQNGNNPSTDKDIQYTTGILTNAPAGTQTRYTSKLPLGTTQNGNNPFTDKDIQYTTGIPTNTPAGTQTTYTSKLPLGTTQNGNNPSTDKDIQYTTGIPINTTAGTQTTYTSKLPLGTTQNGNNPSTDKDIQYTTGIPTNTPAGTQTRYTSKLPLGTTQNGNNPSTDKDIQYTTGIPINTPAGTQTTYTSKLPLGTTQNGNNPSTDKDIQYTTGIPTNAQSSTKSPATTNTQTDTETRYPTTTPSNSTAQITVTAAKTTQSSTSTSRTTAVPVTSNTDVNSQTTTKAPSTASTSSTSRPSTTDNGNPPGSNTDPTNPPEYIDPCTWDTCQLPQCSCYGAQPNTSLEDTPMFLLLTFDGPMTSQLYTNYYEPILVDNGYRFFNQNGCPFRSTVFLAGAGTDYSLVATLATSGHEIASGTLTDRLPLGFSKDDYNDTVNEIDGLRKKVLQEAKSQELHDSIVGFRAPFLKTAFDVQFEVLRDNRFLYDSSISNIEIYSARNPVWPYTMDFGVVQCPNPPCPSKDYPGLWEIPLNGWLGEDGQSCNYVDSCTVGAGFIEAGEEDWYNLFKKNFETYFYPVKTPMHISLRTSTPTENQPLEQAMARWLNDTLSSYNDVWLVTHKMALDWIRDPLTNSQMAARKWGC